MTDFSSLSELELLSYPTCSQTNDNGRNTELLVYLLAWHERITTRVCFPFTFQTPESYQVFKGVSCLYRAPGNLHCLFILLFIFNKGLCCVLLPSGLGERYSGPVAFTFSGFSCFADTRASLHPVHRMWFSLDTSLLHLCRKEGCGREDKREVYILFLLLVKCL